MAISRTYGFFLYKPIFARNSRTAGFANYNRINNENPLPNWERFFVETVECFLPLLALHDIGRVIELLTASHEGIN